jgi:hypothetical protein
MFNDETIALKENSYALLGFGGIGNISNYTWEFTSSLCSMQADYIDIKSYTKMCSKEQFKMPEIMAIFSFINRLHVNFFPCEWDISIHCVETVTVWCVSTAHYCDMDSELQFTVLYIWVKVFLMQGSQ